MPERKFEVIEASPDRKVVASMVTIVVGLTNDRQMTFQTAFEGDETEEAVNRRFDGLMRLADRQKAIYEIIEIEKRIADNLKGKAQFEDHVRTATENRDRDLADFDVQVEEFERLRDPERVKHIAEMDAQILNLQEMRKEHYNLALEANRKSGRSGSFVPRGQDKTNLDRIDLGIKQATSAKEKDLVAWDAAYDERIESVRQERAKRVETARQELQSLQHTVDRHDELIAADKDELAKRRSIAEG